MARRTSPRKDGRVDTDEPASGTPEPSPSPLLTEPSSASDERETDSTGGARLPRRLRRRVHGRLIAGVAGGLADAAGVSPALFRLGFVLLTLLGGLGVLVYLLLWWLIPREDLADSAGQRLLGRFPDAPAWFGVALLILAAVLLAAQFGVWRPSIVLAALLIGLGIVLFRREPWAPVAAPPDRVQPPPGPTTPAGATPASSWMPPPARMRPPRERSSLGWVTLGVALIAGAVAAVLGNTGAVHLYPAQYLALGLCVLGAGLLVGAIFGRARWLILLAILLTPLVLFGSLVRVPLSDGFGDRFVQPASADPPLGPYLVAFGNISIDLSRLPQGVEPPHLAARTGMGNITVVVPPDGWVRVTGDTNCGNVYIGRRERSGFGATLDGTVGTSDGPPLAILNLSTGIGDINVYREQEQPVRPNRSNRPKKTQQHHHRPRNGNRAG